MVETEMSPWAMSFYRAIHDRVWQRNGTAEQFFDDLALHLPSSWVEPEILETGMLNGRRFLSMISHGKKSIVFLPLNWEVAT